MMNMAFKDIRKFDVIDGGKRTHYFKITMIDNIIALCNNKGDTLSIYNNNNKKEVNNDIINKKDKR